MARPKKEGLDYFPLDVDIDQNDKVALIEAKHGVVGFSVIVKLFMKIYKEGYFYKWTEREQLLFSNRVNVDINIVKDVVIDSIEWDLFNKKLYQDHEILTSQGIQERYLDAITRRKEVNLVKSFLLIDPLEYIGSSRIAVYVVNDDGNRVNVNINSTKQSKGKHKSGNNPQSKVKESKVKESKVEESSSREESSAASPPDAIVFYQENFGPIRPYMQENMLKWIDDFGNEGEEMLIEAMTRAMKKGTTSWRFVESILKDWINKGITTKKQADAEEVEFQNSQGQRNSRSGKREIVPEWFENRKNKNHHGQESSQENEQTDEDLGEMIADYLSQG
ncbi:Lin1244/Lin1753 domain-containing protein [Sediminibacillus terrae]|uniref:Lin1244/Lin1753 domain-containing protein n=1 Tax=Sediminibacillus terrae TaxID=1562106 RepID=UPI00129627FF|nr:Lin1244/Lin1753 domain-containing protein [Sediminibacillus terrae]